MSYWFKENRYDEKKIEVRGNNFGVFVKKNLSTPIDAPRIVVVSYQPNKQSSKMLKLCIDSIIKFTKENYELWVIDNNSPLGNIKWLDSYADINLAFIRTDKKLEGSFANSTALEVGAKLIEPESKYFLSFHEDIVVCRHGWLSYLLSKLDDRVRAAGFRLTKARVSEGVLHVCGYIIDFQLFQKLGLSFHPDLPGFDVGDKAIYTLIQNNYDIFYTPNTFDNKDVEKLISDTLELKKINVTRALNDKNEVIYMHLGRGVPKVTKTYSKEGRCTFEQWEYYINHYLFSKPVLQKGNITDFNSYLGYSPREIFIEDFITINIGKKARNIFCLEQKCKILEDPGMDFGARVPENENSYDYIVFPEVIYDSDFEVELKKIYNALRPGGVFLATLPYIHGSRGKNRLSYRWFSGRLWEIGYREVLVCQQGSYNLIKFLLDMERKNLTEKDEKFLRGLNRVMQKDSKYSGNLSNITTGYGFRAVK